MRRILMSAMLAGALVVTPALAQEVNAQALENIKAMLEKHDKALNQQDLKALMETFAVDPKIVVMGTGPGEIWVGQAAIEDAYKHFFADFEAGSMTTNCPWKMGDINGDLAWLMAACEVSDKPKEGAVRQYLLNISAVLQQQENNWRFRTMHFSSLISGSGPGQ